MLSQALFMSSSSLKFSKVANLFVNLRERDHWGDPVVDGRIILRRIFRKWDVGKWTGLSWLRVEKVGGYL
jgi:hypothetical protein